LWALGPLDGFRSANAAVVLVSRSLAPWLRDDDFLLRLLMATGMTNGPSRGLTLLTAAVDEVPRCDRRLNFFGSSEGISILRGRAHHILPGLHRRHTNPDGQEVNLLHSDVPDPTNPVIPQLIFHPPPTRTAGNMTVTVPLANTLFTTGSRHTLLATQWWSSTQEPPRMTHKVERTTQVIHMSPDFMDDHAKPRSTVATYMVPLTPPRKVLASLGNILSGVEVDEQSAPASRELESVIPLLLEQRRKLRASGPGEENAAGGPVGVWALVMPEKCIEEGLTPTPLPLENYSPADEATWAEATSEKIETLLGRGGKLHKVCEF
jgi:hypothetical protein